MPGITLPGTGDILVATDGTYDPPGLDWHPTSLTLAAAGALLDLGATSIRATDPITLAAGTLDLGTGAIAGGTLVPGSAILRANKGTLADVVLWGNLATYVPKIGLGEFANPTLTLSGAIALRGAAGIGAGTLDVVGGAVHGSPSAFVWLADGATLAEGTLRFEGGLLLAGPAPGVGGATIAAAATLALDYEALVTYGRLVNHGLVTVHSTTSSILFTAPVDNDGLIRLTGPGTISLDVVQSAGALLDIAAASRYDGAVQGGRVLTGAQVSGTFADTTLRLGAGTGDTASVALATRLGGAIRLASADGLGPGTIDTAGAHWPLTLKNGMTLESGLLVASPGVTGQALFTEGAATIAPAGQLRIEGDIQIALVNQGTVATALGAGLRPLRLLANDGTLAIGPLTRGTLQVDGNAGVLSIGAGASLSLAMGVQTGAIAIGAGAQVTLSPLVTNQGTTLAPGGVLAMRGLTLAAGGTLTLQAATSATGLRAFTAENQLADGTVLVQLAQGEAFDIAGETIDLARPDWGLGLTNAPAITDVGVDGFPLANGTVRSMEGFAAATYLSLAGVTWIGDLALRGTLGAQAISRGEMLVQGDFTLRRPDGGRGTVDLANGVLFLQSPVTAAQSIGAATFLLGHGAELQGSFASGVSVLDLPAAPGTVPSMETLVSNGIPPLGGPPASGAAGITVRGALDATRYRNEGGRFVIDGGTLRGGPALGLVHFAGPSGTLDLTHTFSFQGVVENYQAGDFIHLPVSPGFLLQGLNLAYDGRSLIYLGNNTLDLGPAAPPEEAFYAVDDGAGGIYLGVNVAGTVDAPDPSLILVPGLERSGLLRFDPARRAMAHALLDAPLAAVTADPALLLGPGAVSAPGGMLVVSTGAAAAMPLGARVAVAIGEARGLIAAGASNGQAILAGDAGAVVLAGAGSGTMLSAAGDNLFFAPGADAGDWRIDWGAGNDVAVASFGDDTIAPGGGDNVVWLGAGATSVRLDGAHDVVAGAAGPATIATGAGSAAIYAGTGPLVVTGGVGSTTVVGGSGGTTLTGGAGGSVFFGFGPLAYTAGTGTDVLVGGTGAMTATGGTGGGVFWGGTGGANLIRATGAATLVGGHAGDVLASYGNGTHALYGGTGATTISAADSNGMDLMLAGTGPVSMVGGAGSSLMVAGPGGGTLAGGTGAALFEFINGYGGAAVTVTGFDAARMQIALPGFSPTEVATARAAATAGPAGWSITLPDGTTILFASSSAPPAGAFI